jgi:hypothetical protein
MVQHDQDNQSSAQVIDKVQAGRFPRYLLFREFRCWLFIIVIHLIPLDHPYPVFSPPMISVEPKIAACVFVVIVFFLS